jgi:hypothetical protein
MMTGTTAPNLVSLETHVVTARTAPAPGELGAAMLNFLYRALRVIGISVGASLALAWVSANFFQV